MEEFNNRNRPTVTPDQFKDGKNEGVSARLKKIEEDNRLRNKFGDFKCVETYFRNLFENGKIEGVEFLRKQLKDNEKEIKDSNLIENDEAIKAIIDGDVKLVWENGQLKVEVVKKELTSREQKKKEVKKEQVSEQIELILKSSGKSPGRNEDFYSGSASNS